MTRAGVVLAVWCCLVFGAACGSDSSDAEPSGDDGGGTTVADDQGSSDDGGADDSNSADAASGGGATDEVPIPVPDGGDELPVPGLNGRSIDYPADDFDRIVAFYDEWTASQPQEFITTELPDSKAYLNDRPTDAEESIVITVTRVEDFTNVLVGYDPPPGE